MPTLYLHGTDDGCFTADYTPWIERMLPDGSEMALVENGGHFLQLDQPDVVARHIVDFIGRAATRVGIVGRRLLLQPGMVAGDQSASTVAAANGG